MDILENLQQALVIDANWQGELVTFLTRLGWFILLTV